MNNMIEFRGISKENYLKGQWVYGVPFTTLEGNTHIITKATEDTMDKRNEVDFAFVVVIPETVEMGITIKGTTYFTGDILCWEADQSTKYVVDFKEGSFILRFKDKDIEWGVLSKCLEIARGYNTSLIVIGNIHEVVNNV